MRTNVYIDGFNLFYGCLKGTHYKWLDLETLCRRILPHDQVGRIRYFTAPINFRPDKPWRQIRQQTYLRAVATLPSVHTHMGSFLISTCRMRLAEVPENGPNTVEVIKAEEKGSDVNLATYLLLDAFRHDAEAFVVITNDSDLTEPIRIVGHELDRVVGVVNPHPPRRRSRALLRCEPTFFKQVWPSTLARSQFPDKLNDADGEILRPDGW